MMPASFTLIILLKKGSYLIWEKSMGENWFSKKMLELMAKEFYGAELSEEHLEQILVRMENWVKKIEGMDFELIEGVEPSGDVYKYRDRNEDEEN
jgi:hypothetical protein